LRSLQDNYIDNEIADDIIGAIRDEKIDPKIAFKMKKINLLYHKLRIKNP